MLTMALSWDLLFWSCGAALSLAALWFFYWALLHDRARGRRRCPKCWYDMSGTPGNLTCSECGFIARNEARFFQTRRRWRWVVVPTASLLLAVTCFLAPRVQRDGWTSVVPTTLLVLFVHRLRDNPASGVMSATPVQPSFAHTLGPELLRRIQKQSLWKWQQNELVRRAAVLLSEPATPPHQLPWASDIYDCVLNSGDVRPAFPALARMLAINEKQRVRAYKMIRSAIRSPNVGYAPALLPMLLPLIEDENSTATRCVAIELVGELEVRGESAIEALRRNGRETDNAAVRLYAAIALARIDPEPTYYLPVLEHVLQNSTNEAARYLAAEAIRTSPRKYRSTIHVLVTALQDEHHGVRWSAAAAVGKYGPEAADEVEPLLNRLREEKERTVRRALIETLDKLVLHVSDRDLQDEIVKIVAAEEKRLATYKAR